MSDKTSNKVSNTNELADIVMTSVLKRTFKQYLADEGHDTIRISYYPKYLVISLVMILEELLTDCLEYVKKHETNGLYIIDYPMLLMVLSNNTKYNVFVKNLKKYNSTTRYQESVFFNYRKVIGNLENKYGNKLMIDANASNFIAYLLVCLQYELLKLSITLITFSNIKTLNMEALLCSYNFLLEELHPKIKLKLDSIRKTKETNDKDDTEETEDEKADDEPDEPDEPVEPVEPVEPPEPVEEPKLVIETVKTKSKTKNKKEKTQDEKPVLTLEAEPEPKVEVEAEAEAEAEVENKDKTKTSKKKLMERKEVVDDDVEPKTKTQKKKTKE
jgi:hypothetical protein